MQSYDNFKEAKQNVISAKAWLSNKTKIDSQDKKHYALTGVKFSAEYCGQAYAGANNYHESPKEFNQAVCEVIKNDYFSIFNKALEILEKKESEALIACEDEALNLLKEINSAKDVLEVKQ